MLSNSGDASQPDRSTASGVGGMFSNSGDAPPRAPVNPNNNPGSGMFSNTGDAPQPDAYGGAQREQGMGPQDPNLPDDGADEGRTGAPSAGYDNNIEREGGGGGGKKHGILGKIKDAFVPKPGSIGRTGNEDLVRIIFLGLF
jgi:hypothetical protein